MSKKDAQKDPLMRAAEVAEVAGVVTRTLRRWSRDGYGPQPFRLGPRVLVYKRAEVEAWLANRESRSA